MWLAVLANSLVGCAPSVRLANPADWPQTWCERRLYHTPLAYIYAGSNAAAGEADRLLRAVAKDFEHESGAGPAKGLVIVTDRNDPLPPGPWLELDRFLEQQRGDVPPAATAPAPPPDGSPPAASAPASQPGEEKRSPKAQLAKLGLSTEMLCRMASLGLPMPQARQLIDLPAEIGETPKWFAHLPTRSLLADCNRQMMQAMFKTKEVSPAARLMVAPILAMMEPKMVDALAAAREAAVFSAFAQGHPAWSEQQKREFSKTYSSSKMKQATDDLNATAKEAAARSRSRVPPAASQPDTQPATRPAPDAQPASATAPG